MCATYVKTHCVIVRFFRQIAHCVNWVLSRVVFNIFYAVCYAVWLLVMVG